MFVTFGISKTNYYSNTQLIGSNKFKYIDYNNTNISYINQLRRINNWILRSKTDFELDSKQKTRVQLDIPTVRGERVDTNI